MDLMKHVTILTPVIVTGYDGSFAQRGRLQRYRCGLEGRITENYVLAGGGKYPGGGRRDDQDDQAASSAQQGEETHVQAAPSPALIFFETFDMVPKP